MDRFNEFQAPEYKRLWSAHILKAYMVCVRISLECTWRCGDFSEFGYAKPMVSHHQELLVGFIPPLVLTIFLQDEFQKWGSSFAI